MATSNRFVTSHSNSTSPSDYVDESLPRLRRPRSEIHTVIISNTVNARNHWIQLQLARGSWVLLQPRGRKHSSSKNIFLKAWKARIKDFKIETGKKIIKEVLVQHVYMHKEIVLSREDQSH